ncbi:MAG TPA: transcriptional regulator [Stellaceae bacterium]|nr:transcriptional regulator [Stellaceae bacterium]
MAMLKLKVTKVGNSKAVILTKEAAARLKVEEGDVLFLVETPTGYRLTPYDLSFEQKMDVARKVMKKRRTLLRELAK